MSRALRRALAMVGVTLLAGCSKSAAPTRIDLGDRPPLKIAFVSERPPSPPFSADIYFYDVATGGPAYPAPNVNTTNVEGPCALSADGRHMAFYTNRAPTGTVVSILLYDVATGVTTIPHWTNTLDNLNNPSLSGDGRLLAFQYVISGTDLYVGVEDLKGDSLLPVSNLNVPGALTFDPSLSADGKFIAFASNRAGGAGGFDVYLYSVPGDSLVPLPGLNTSSSDLAPSLSADGRYLAFQSNRVGTYNGVIDIYLYDVKTQSMIPLPGANSPLADFLPSISPDGRYIAFSTEATGGRDVRMYDVVAQRLVDLPHLNDPYFYDYFPSVSNR